MSLPDGPKLAKAKNYYGKHRIYLFFIIKNFIIIINNNQ